MNSSNYLFRCGNSTFEYTIERSARRNKTIAIYVKPETGVIVRAPLSVRKKFIQKFIEAKSPWILKKLSAANSMTVFPRQFTTGEIFSYLGQDHKLVLICSTRDRSSILTEDKKLIVPVPEGLNDFNRAEFVKDALRYWYVAEANQVISRLVNELSAATGLVPAKVKVKNLKRSWGSCSGHNNVSFNWRLIMAPLQIIEYVVVHELCHIKEKNHSKNFWLLLERHIPDCKDIRKQLKLVGHTYEL